MSAYESWQKYPLSTRCGGSTRAEGVSAKRAPASITPPSCSPCSGAKRLIAPSPVIRIFAAVIGSAVDVAVDIEHSIDEAGAENGAEEEISSSDIEQT